MFQRIYSNIQSFVQKGKVLVIYGPRRVGKTTLITSFVDTSLQKILLENGENKKLSALFANNNKKDLLARVEGYDVLIIDEAQDIPAIALGLKTLVDNCTDLTIIVTGSSSFVLRQSLGEPLTGRKITLTLYPLSIQELARSYNSYHLHEHLSDYLIFGLYPEVVLADTLRQKILLLNDMVESYLLKDILALDRVQAPKQLRDLLKLLAYQIGSEVSLSEIAQQIGLDQKTVGRYIDLLVKGFVIMPLSPRSTNMRNSIKQKSKYYFWDLGLRNALIGQFAQDVRNDRGALWENFVVMEMIKYNDYNYGYGNRYFWRDYQGAEIDVILEKDGVFFCYECKRSSKKKSTLPSAFATAMKDKKIEYHIINPENYLGYVGI